MIQELLGGAGGFVEKRKISIPAGLLLDGSILSSTTITTTTPSSSSATSSPSPSPSSPTTSTDNQNLRCPRCDSSNTKFCYYNNYNLTQPRHFCKTCRRYWTKGGALRNVPIGGGCRKTKSTSASIGSAGKSGGTKAKSGLDATVAAGKSSLGGGGGDVFNHELPSSQILWPSAQQSSNLLALLRSTPLQSSNATPLQSPNPNPNPLNTSRIKEELSHFVPTDATLVTNPLNARTLGLDPLGHVPTGLCTPLWRSNPYQYHHQQQHQMPQQQQQQNMLFGTEVPTSGIHEMYQRLRSNYYTDHSQVLLGNMGSSPSTATTATATTAIATTATTTTTASSIMEPYPVTGGEFGFWNLPLSWSDMSTTNGAFP